MMKHKNFIIVLIIGCVTVSFSFQSKFFEIAKQIEIYNNLFKTLNVNYIDEINPAELTNKAIKNTLNNLDPYTRFYNEQQLEDAKIRREGEYGGIGISSYNSKNGIVITEIKEGFSAQKAGLKVGDIITNVNGQDLKALEKSQLSQVLKGIPDTPVSLTIKREQQAINFDLKLDKVIVEPVPFYDMINADAGYVILTQFTNAKATNQVTKAIKELKKKGMKKLVLDLRNNPGGSLSDAINITNLFIPYDKKVVDTKGKLKKVSRSYKTTQQPLDAQMPVVVLINGRSASASEIVSGALQDYDRAVVIGNRSYGKGLVQRYFELNYGTQMKATISKYYTPSGRCIQELDYANRDPKTGKVPKFSDGTVNAFKTTNGRTVYDGGGVTPDIIMKTSEQTKDTKRLLESKAIFNYAVDYVRKHPTADITTFEFKNTDFNAFKTYLKTTDTTFVTKQEKLFKKAYKSVEKTNGIASNYNSILLSLQNDKISQISKNKDIITTHILDEILKQYFFEKGAYQYHLKRDETIKKAVDVLNNSKEYHKILGNK